MNNRMSLADIFRVADDYSPIESENLRDEELDPFIPKYISSSNLASYNN